MTSIASPTRVALQRLILALLDAVPGPVTGTLRTHRFARVVARAVSILTYPLHGEPVTIRRGEASGLSLYADAQSLSWITGKVEPEVQRALRQGLRPGSVFFDIGASVGFFTVLGAQLVGDSGSVVAFEPEPASFAAVQRNVRLNDLRSVLLLQKAISSAPGEGVLDAQNPATAHLVSGSLTPSGKPVTVEVTSVDAFVAEHPELVPGVVKADVEGHEAAVLRGMTRTLDEHRPIVIVELHETGRGYLSILEGAGYALSVLEGSVSPAAARSGAHVLAVPGEGRSP
jgi:FkbM family methyltransferase